jgi:hypothetical protein
MTQEARPLEAGIYPFPDLEDVFADPVERYARHFLPLCSIDLACVNPAWHGRIHMVQPIEPVDSLIGERTTAHHGEWLRTNWVGFFLREGRYHWAGDWKYLQLEDPDTMKDWEREELLGKYEDVPACFAATREHYRQHRQLYVPIFRQGNVREAGTLRLLRKRAEVRGFHTDTEPHPLLQCLGGSAPSGNWDEDGDCKEWPLVSDECVSEGSGRFLPLTPDGRRFHFIASVEPALYGVDAGCDTLLFYDPVLSVALFTYDWS